MSERRTVVEVIATAALGVEIPIDYGDELGDGVETVLAEIDDVRHAAIEERGDVTPGTDQLRAEMYVRLTFHFDPDAVDDAEEAAQDRLATSDSISSVKTFITESGPYRIEAW